MFPSSRGLMAASLRRAAAQVDQQPITRHDIFPSTTGSSSMDAGTSGFRAMDLASERVRANRSMGQSSEGTFNPFGDITESESKDGDSSDIFMPVRVIHSSTLLLGDAGTYQFQMGYGQWIFNLMGVTGAGQGRVTAADSICNLQTINALCEHAHDIKMQLVEDGCRIDTYPNVDDPHGYNADSAGSEMDGYADDNDEIVPYGSTNGMKDPYAGKPVAFSSVLETLTTKDPVMWFNDDEFLQRVCYMGMWHGKGDVDRGQFREEVLGFGDNHMSSMSSRKSSGADAASTVLVRGENKSGTPNVIGNTLRVLMSFWFVLNNRTSPGMFDDPDRFNPVAPRLTAWASTKMHRPAIMTSSADFHKYKRVHPDETMMDYDSMALLRYGGNVPGAGVVTSLIEFVRKAGARQDTDKSPLADTREREPMYDSGQYELAFGYSEREKSACCWTTLRNKPAFYVGKTSYISAMSKTSPGLRTTATLNLADNLKLMGLSKFEVYLAV